MGIEQSEINSQRVNHYDYDSVESAVHPALFLVSCVLGLGKLFPFTVTGVENDGPSEKETICKEEYRDAVQYKQP
jgi:hypothetical protein